ARVRRPGLAARRLGRLLPGLGPARVDASAREDLAGDLRAAGLPERDPRGSGDCRPLARHLAAAHHRCRVGTARPLGLPPRRALREEARKAEEVRMKDWFAGPVAARYDESTADMPVEPVVEFLAALAGAGPALELAIGTGR